MSLFISQIMSRQSKSEKLSNLFKEDMLYYFNPSLALSPVLIHVLIALLPVDIWFGWPFHGHDGTKTYNTLTDSKSMQMMDI